MFFVRLPTNYLPTSFSSRFNDSLTSWKIGIVVESVETEETMENFSSSQFFPIRFSAPWRRERSYMRVRKLTLEPTFIPDNASLGRDTSLSLSHSSKPTRGEALIPRPILSNHASTLPSPASPFIASTDQQFRNYNSKCRSRGSNRETRERSPRTDACSRDRTERRSYVLRDRLASNAA